MRRASCRCGTCLKCRNRRKSAAYRERHRERARATQRDVYARNAVKYRAMVAKRRIDRPQQAKAQSIVSNAIRAGKLVRQPCEVCGGWAQAHHEDYAKPLDVRWLCPIHHAREHTQVAA